MKTRLSLAIALLVACAGGYYLWNQSSSGKDTDSVSAQKLVDKAPATGPASGSNKVRLSTLSGQVRSSDDSALVAASVQLVPQGKQSTRLSAHDAVTLATVEGRFRLAEIPPGEYVLTASAPGFLPTQEEIEVFAGADQSKITLTLEAGGHGLSGVVRDLTGGTVAAAIIHVFPLGLSELDRKGSASAQSDDAGHYELNLGTGRYLVQASHTDYVPKSQLIEVSGAQVLDFGLAPGAVVEGVVRHEGSGEVVANAVVSYSTQRVSRFNIFSNSVGGGATRSDAQGHFRITGLNSGALELSARGDNAATTESTLVALGIAEQRTDVELFVASAYRVSGQVVDQATQEPIAGVQVSANRDGMGIAASSASNAKGEFEITGLPAGAYQLQGSADEYLPQLFGTKIDVQKDLEDARIELSKGAMIYGRVEPATKAEIGVDLSNIKGLNSNAFLRVQSASDGSFAFGPLSPSSFTLQATSADGMLGETEVKVPEEGLRDVVIQLENGASIAGKVVDASGNALGDVRVSLRPDTGNRRMNIVVNGRDMMASQAHTSPDGSYKISGLKAGKYKMSVLDPQGDALLWAADSAKTKEAANRPKSISLLAQEQKEGVQLRVEDRDASIAGRVVDAEGKPVADVWVRASAAAAGRMGMPGPPTRGPPPSPDGEGPSRTSRTTVVMMVDDGGGHEDDGPGLDLGRGGEMPPVLTDEKGEFKITGLREGKFDLIAEGMRGTARGFADSVETGEDTTIQLQVLTKVEGRVKVGSEAATSFSVELTGGTRRNKRVRNEEGKFTLHRVDPGRYTLKVRSQEGEAETQIEVVAGKTTEVEVELLTLTSIRGTVVDEARQPIAGAIVTPVPRRDDGQMNLMIGDDAELTGKDGKFEFGVRPGKYLVIVLKPGQGPLARQTLDVAEGEGTVDLGTITGKAGSGLGPPGEDEG